MTRVAVLNPSYLLTEQTDEEFVDDDSFKIKWTNLEYIYKVPLLALIRKKVLAPSDPVIRYSYILKGINGSFGRGQLIAVMGPSGSGKSTFLETLIGRRPQGGIKGSITCETKKKLRVSFIPQSNAFFDGLTVKQTMSMAYSLFRSTEKKVSKRVKKDESEVDAVGDMIIKLSLQSCVNNPIKKCSGGQLKRLAIACELLRSTDLLVMDEPTSGLDSASTLALMQLLSKVVKERNVTIMMTIHQPSFRVFSTFDTIYGLSCEGKCLYNGPPNHVLPFLAHHGFPCPSKYNPADFMIDVASGNYGMDGLINLYREFLPNYGFEVENNNNQSQEKEDEKVSFLEQIQYDDHPFIPHIMVLMKRSILVTLTNPWLFGIRLVSHIIFAIMVGFQMTPERSNSGGCPLFPALQESVFGHDWKFNGSSSVEVDEFNPSDLEAIQSNSKRQEDAVYDLTGLIYLNLLNMQFGAILPTILTMPLEVRAVMKERKNDWYSVSSYYWAKVVADIPFQILFPCLYNGILFLFALYNLEVVDTASEEVMTTLVSPATMDLAYRYFMLSVVYVLFVLTAQAHGLIIGVIFLQSPTASGYIGTVSMIPFILFSGFLIRVKDLHVIFQYVTYGSYMRYAFELCLIVYFDWHRCSNGVQYGHHFENTRSESIEKLFLASKQEITDWLYFRFDAGEDGATGISDFWIKKLSELIVGDIESRDGRFKPFILQTFGVDGNMFTLFLAILAFQAVLYRVVTFLLLRTKIKTQE